MERMTVQLLADEKEALWQIAERERRDPRDQAAMLIRRELERLGLLSPVLRAETPAPAGQEARYDQ